MHRFIIAAALGLGLLSAGGTANVASAGSGASATLHERAEGAPTLGLVHYQRHGHHGPYRYVAPHHHRWYAPTQSHRGYHSHYHGQRHGHPQAWHSRDRNRESRRHDWRG